MKWNSDFIRDSDRRINYYYSEGDKHPVILLHGAMDNGLCWIHTATKLAKNYHVIMPDARGHGFTETPEDEPFSYELMADDVMILTQELNLKKPQIIGHSMGAAVAALVAAKYPDIVSKVILEDPPFRFIYIPKWSRGIVKLIMKIAGWYILRGSYKKIMEKGKKNNPTWPKEVFLPWAESKIQYKEKNKKYLLGLLKSSYNWKKVVSDIKCPLLLISSSKGITNDKIAKRVIELSKKGTWVKINNAGHNIRREQSDKFMETINGFLK